MICVTPVMLFLKVYLFNRLQKVYINNETSNTCLVKTGVPQGSILGPFAFHYIY